MNKFWVKTVNLLLVVGLLFGYNGILKQRTQAEEIDRLQAELETEKNNVSEQVASVYQDGTYEGSAEGFGGLITVQVTMESDTITDIAIMSAPKEDRAYLEMASSIVNDILEKQTTEVDTVSGATFSSTGIRNAVSDALEKAEN